MSGRPPLAANRRKPATPIPCPAARRHACLSVGKSCDCRKTFAEGQARPRRNCARLRFGSLPRSVSSIGHPLDVALRPKPRQPATGPRGGAVLPKRTGSRLTKLPERPPPPLRSGAAGRRRPGRPRRTARRSSVSEGAACADGCSRPRERRPRLAGEASGASAAVSDSLTIRSLSATGWHAASAPPAAGAPTAGRSSELQGEPEPLSGTVPPAFRRPGRASVPGNTVTSRAALAAGMSGKAGHAWEGDDGTARSLRRSGQRKPPCPGRRHAGHRPAGRGIEDRAGRRRGGSGPGSCRRDSLLPEGVAGRANAIHCRCQSPFRC